MATQLARSLPDRADLSRGELRAARVDAIGTATAEGHSLSKADMNGLLALRGNQDGGSPLPCAAVTVFRVLACK